MKCPYCNGRRVEPTNDDFAPYRCNDCQTLILADDVPDDGRIRSADDVPRRIAGARDRREADELIGRHELRRELHELYCAAAEREGWVEILAADTWAERELTATLGRKVHRTEIRRARVVLEELGYVRRVGRPVRIANREAVRRHKQEHRTKAPLVIEVLKAPARGGA